MKEIIIDFEFNSLLHLEVCQAKMINLTDGKRISKNFKTINKQNASSIVCCGGKITGNTYFTKQEFLSMTQEIGVAIDDKFFGFGISMDKQALEKVDINLKNYIDIQEMLMLSKYEKTLAKEGRSLEACYYIVTGRIPTLSHHGDMAELNIIKEIYDIVKELPQNEYLTVYPWGTWAGMDLPEFCYQYRRNADGYRYNNNNLLSRSLDHIINELEGIYWDDEIEED